MLRYFPLIARGDVVAFGPIMDRFGFSSAMQAKDYRGRTALHVAVEHGRDEIVAMLLAHNAEPEAKNDDGFTALHLAAELGNLKIVTQLLEKTGAESLQIRTQERGLTALHLAVGNGHAAVVQHLLAVSPDLIEVDDLNGKTVLQYAAEYGHEDIFAILMTQTPEDKMALHFAVAGGCETITSRLLVEKPHLLEVEDTSGRTPLHVAAEHGHSTIVAQLIALRPEFLSLTTNQKETVLHLAAKQGQAAVIPLLLAAKPDLLDIEDNHKITPLRRACTNAHEKVVALLLSYKPRVVDVSCCNNALGSGPNEKIIRMLLAHNPRFVDEVSEGKTILHYAFRSYSSFGICSEEFMTEVWRLCAPGLVRQDRGLSTPLHVAINCNNQFAIELVHGQFSTEELVKIFGDCGKRFPRSLLDKHCGAALLLLTSLPQDVIMGAIYDFLVGTSKLKPSKVSIRVR